jgi:hypothetical protein
MYLYQILSIGTTTSCVCCCQPVEYINIRYQSSSLKDISKYYPENPKNTINCVTDQSLKDYYKKSQKDTVEYVMNLYHKLNIIGIISSVLDENCVDFHSIIVIKKVYDDYFHVENLTNMFN